MTHDFPSPARIKVIEIPMRWFFGLRHDDASQRVLITITHPSFAEVQPGQEIPSAGPITIKGGTVLDPGD